MTILVKINATGSIKITVRTYWIEKYIGYYLGTLDTLHRYERIIKLS